MDGQGRPQGGRDLALGSDFGFDRLKPKGQDISEAGAPGQDLVDLLEADARIPQGENEVEPRKVGTGIHPVTAFRTCRWRKHALVRIEAKTPDGDAGKPRKFAN